MKKWENIWTSILVSVGTVLFARIIAAETGPWDIFLARLFNISGLLICDLEHQLLLDLMTEEKAFFFYTVFAHHSFPVLLLLEVLQMSVGVLFPNWLFNLHPEVLLYSQVFDLAVSASLFINETRILLLVLVAHDR